MVIWNKLYWNQFAYAYSTITYFSDPKIDVEYQQVVNAQSGSSTVNVTCNIDASDGKPTFRIDYDSTTQGKVRVIEKYEPLVSDLGYYFSGSFQEQILVYGDTDVVCTVNDARGQYINKTRIAINGKVFWYTYLFIMISRSTGSTFT